MAGFVGINVLPGTLAISNHIIGRLLGASPRLCPFACLVRELFSIQDQHSRYYKL
jgi:hypothetical protein